MGIPESLIAMAQIIAIDALMAGDNAVMIGMAAASVPAEKRARIISWSIAAAVVLRILIAFAAVWLLSIVGLTLAGGLLLAYVTYRMYLEFKKRHPAQGVIPKEASTMQAIINVTLADLSMSFDNVFAVAGAAKDNLLILTVGLIISVAFTAFAAKALAGFIERHRGFAWAGLALVAYVAIDMIIRGGTEVALFAF